MHSRFVVPLLCAAAIVFACGPRFHAGAPGSTPASRFASANPSRARLQPAPHRRKGDTTAVEYAFAVDTTQGEVRLALDVVNVTRRRLEIDFPNGQTREFVIYDATGREQWRWSKGRLFTQAVQNKFLASGDTARYEAQWTPPTPGRYSAVAILRSHNFPVKRSVEFIVAPTGARVAALGNGGR